MRRKEESEMMINGFYALCPRKGGYAQIPWESPPKGQFSITIRFLPDTPSPRGGLLSLGSALSVELYDGRLRLRAGGTDTTFNGTITARCENTVTVVCDGAKLTVYQNGISVIEKKETVTDSVSFLRIGESLDSVCILRSAIFHEPLSAADICKSLVSKNFPCHRKIDFTKKSLPADIMLCEAGIENCIYALACAEGGFSMDSVRLPREYTLSFSIYLSEKIPAEAVLFHTPKMRITLEDPFGIGRPKVVIRRMEHGTECQNATAFFLETRKWVTLTFVFSASDIRVYFDSQFMMSCSYESFEETGTVAVESFAGCLGACVIAGQAVPESEMASFLQRPFGAFDNDLLYLLDFSEYDPAEMWLESCKGKKLTPCGGIPVLLRGTDAPVCTDKRRGGPVSSREYSDFVNWQIGVLIRLLVEWLYEQLGIYPNRGIVDRSCNPWEIDVNLHQFIHRDILSMNEAQIVLCYHDDIGTERFTNLILAMKQNGTLKKLIAYLYQEDENQDSINDILYWLLAAALLAAAVAAVLSKPKWIPEPPDPPRDHHDSDDDDDDDDKKKKKTDVSIKQVSLNGGLPISYGPGNEGGIASVKAADEAPKENTAVFVRKGSISNPDLKVTLSFRGDKDEFEIFAENTNGRIISGCHESVSSDGNGQKTISLKIQTENFRENYGKCRETLSWRCQSKEGKHVTFLGNKNFDLYFLEGKPCGPWTAGIPIECLKLCADCAASAEGHSAGFFKDYIKYLEHGIQMQENTAAPERYVTQKAYSHIHTGKDEISVFDAAGFAKAYRHGKRDITKNDLLYSVVILCCLNGYQSVQALGLSSNISYESEDGKEETVPLLLRRSPLSEEIYCPDEKICWVLSASHSIYDFNLGADGLPFSKGNTKYITELSDTTHYREKYYAEGSYCGEACLLDKDSWRIGNVPSGNDAAVNEGLVNAAGDLPDRPGFGTVVLRGGVYIHDGRENLDHDTRIFMSSHLPGEEERQHFNAICHSISAQQMDLIIADICNNHVPDSLNYLNAFVDALYHGVAEEQEQEEFIQIYHQITNRLKATLHRCLAHNNMYTPDVVAHFSLLALSSPGNLRWGNSSRNIAVRNNFDPVMWFYFLSPDAQNVTHEGGLANPCRQGELLQKLHEHYPHLNIQNLPDDQPGFYLPSQEDGVRIQRLIDLGATVHIDANI